MAASLSLVVTLLPSGRAVGQTNQTCGDSSQFVSGDVPKSIPDNGAVTSTLVVPTAGFIQDLDVRVDITHPFDSDLRVELVPPTGPSLTLADTIGLWGDDFTATMFDDEADAHVVSALPPFTGRFVANDPLSVLDRMDQAGTWTLSVTDQRGGYAGTIDAWSLDITTCGDITPPTGQAIKGSAFSDPFQTKRTFEVRWAAGSDDEAGVASRDVNYWSALYTEGFTGAVEWRRATTSLRADFTGSPGRTYCFAERLRDEAGNVSGFSPLKCTALPVNDDALAHTNEWTEKSGTGFYLNDYLFTNARFAELRLPVSGKRFALVATTCPGCGAVDVFMGSTRIKRISLASDAVRKRQIIPVKTFGSVQSGELKIVVASSRKKVIVEGLGVSRPAVQQLPAVEANAGAPSLPDLPQTVPTGGEELTGTLITVTSSSDATNGTVSSVAGLQGSPGADGISLREAIQATNNDPGQYTIRFAPGLKGMTIAVGATTGTGLPSLTGGGVLIDGDIDGDGLPDVTLLESGPGGYPGLALSSSGNRLHALMLQGFTFGVGIGFNVSAEQASSNTVTGMVLIDIERAGISGPGGRIDTRVIGNTIESESAEGIALSAMDVVERITVAGNSLHNNAGMSFHVGNQGNNGRLADVLVAYNSIEENTIEGISFISGLVGGQFNVIERVRILGNEVHKIPATGPGAPLPIAILIAAGDAGTDFVCRECRPIVYPDDNVVRDVEISGNTLVDGGVDLAPACCGATRNTIQDVRIEGNVIRGDGVFLSAGATGCCPPGSQTPSRLTFDNEIVGVSIEGNTTAGISVLGGSSSLTGTSHEVRIANNLIDTDGVGIHLLGGWTNPAPAPGLSASGNAVFQVEILANVVFRAPAPGVVDPRVRGITLTGGMGYSSTDNSVTCVTLADNLVVGVLDDVAVLQNVGTGASGNTASLGGC